METALDQQTQEDFHLSRHILESLPYKNRIINKVISKLEREQLTKIKEDTLGILFEKLIREQEKKDLGQFYTPQELVNYMISFLNIKSDSKILDPTCGCGVFLVTAYNNLKQKNQDAINNIFGVDLNDSATKIARINLWLRNGQDSESLNILEKNIKIGNYIIENKRIDKKAFDWQREFSEIFKEGGFDFIIGNPPYVTVKNKRDYDVSESFFSHIANGSTNAASLVIAKSYELLKDGGIMAFVLPKTLIRVNSYSKLREFLLQNSRILHILDLGPFFKEVRGEQIVLFIQKTTNKEQIKNNKILVKVFGENTEFYISQKVLQRYNSLLMFEGKFYYDLIEKIKGEKLETVAEIFRGISISPTSNSISNSKSEKKISIIKGNDISKSFFTNEFFIDVNSLINSSKLKRFRKRKIILQNIFSSEAGIISAIDENGNLNFDTVSNIIPKSKFYSLEYIYGLLNSKLINFYLMYAIFNKSKLTMHTDKVYLGKIPIRKISKEKQREIIRIIKRMNKDNLKKILPELDKKVYDLYGINKFEQDKVDAALKKIMSKRSLW